MAVPTTLLLSILSLILLPSPSAANEANTLATGEFLPTNGQLSYKDAAFVIQNDCNLVLYSNKANKFQSDTHGNGFNCTLTLSDYGKLVIKSGDGKHVWSSPGGSKKGKYVAILGPDGKVKVFGPSIWPTPEVSLPSATIDAELEDVPLGRNVLFSSEVLNQTSTLLSRDGSFKILYDCTLSFWTESLRDVLWVIDKNDMGDNCFVRLDNWGKLALVSDSNKVLWSSNPTGTKGDYAFVVGIHGQAVIYGPVVWSTGP